MPFLDHELVELAARIPPEHKLAQGGKGVLKEAARLVVPPEVIDRPKGYFPGAGAEIYRGSLSRHGARRADLTCGARARRCSARSLSARSCSPTPKSHITPLRGSELWQVGAAGDVAAGSWHLKPTRSGKHAHGEDRDVRRKLASRERLRRRRDSGAAGRCRRDNRRRGNPESQCGRSIAAGAGCCSPDLRQPRRSWRDACARRARTAATSPSMSANPHVLLAAAPQELFLDPSHTYRLDLKRCRCLPRKPSATAFSSAACPAGSDADAVNRIYLARHMVPVPPDFFWSTRDSRALTVLVAEDEANRRCHRHGDGRRSCAGVQRS